jgi:hypothetical protein
VPAKAKLVLVLTPAQVYELPDLGRPVYVAEGLSFVPPTISPQYTARRSAARETLTEILVAELGDATSRTPYLIVSFYLPGSKCPY